MEEKVKNRGEIIALVLAAGESRRMNSPKMLLPFGKKTIIEEVLENVTASRADRTIVVIGSSADKVTDLAGNYTVTVCYNDNYKQGMLSSVWCGYNNLPEVYGAAIIFLGDQPMIKTAVIDSLIDKYNKENGGIIVPVCKGRRGHPILIGYKYHREVMDLDPGKGLRELTSRFPDDVHEVEITAPEILKDIDTLEDYLKEINQNN